MPNGSLIRAILIMMTIIMVVLVVFIVNMPMMVIVRIFIVIRLLGLGNLNGFNFIKNIVHPVLHEL